MEPTKATMTGNLQRAESAEISANRGKGASQQQSQTHSARGVILEVNPRDQNNTRSVGESGAGNGILRNNGQRTEREMPTNVARAHFADDVTLVGGVGMAVEAQLPPVRNPAQDHREEQAPIVEEVNDDEV